MFPRRCHWQLYYAKNIPYYFNLIKRKGIILDVHCCEKIDMRVRKRILAMRNIGYCFKSQAFFSRVCMELSSMFLLSVIDVWMGCFRSVNWEFRRSFRSLMKHWIPKVEGGDEMTHQAGEIGEPCLRHFWLLPCVY